VACSAADCSRVGSMRTFTTCFTPATLTTSTDNYVLPRARYARAARTESAFSGGKQPGILNR